ncbi:MAG: DUF2029 domain-containing protein [bacterium]|nr:DUF2029 domain-containing protein [bacterium]
MSKVSHNTDDLADATPVTIGSFSIPREFVWVLVLTLVLVVGLAVAASPWAVYRNDPIAFADRSRPFLDGQLPYVDYEFEHLPLAFLPMLTAALLETVLPINYTIIFWLVMSGVLFGCGVALNRLGDKVGVSGAALRWVLISWAVVPLLSFRLDALSVLLTLLALLWAIDGRTRQSAWAMGGAIAAKGWPIVLSVVDWWRGKRRRAAVTVALTAFGVLGLALFPMFRSGRSFSGVHIETFTGALIALVRNLSGSSTQVSFAAGASYVDVGAWALVVNVLIGLSLGLFALRVLKTQFNWRTALDLIGVLTIALMLLSPLLSAQFIFWATPFAALSASSKVQSGIAAAVILTGVFVTFWFMDSWWWWAVIAARNAILLGTGWVWAQHLLNTEPPVHDEVLNDAVVQR